MNLSKNFTLEELTYSQTAKNKGINNAPCEMAKNQLQQLCTNLLEPIRAAYLAKYGESIQINSAYRSRQLNSSIGGASKTSQHMKGEAADLRVGGYRDKTKNKQLYDLINEMIDKKQISVGQIINEYGYSWVHVSLGTKNQRLTIGK